jgi:hypothetical protein
MPLWGRAKATLANSRILSDPKAVEISRKLGVDFQKLGRALPASNNLVSIARARVLDDLIRSFLWNHPRATIVNLGAGLDTAFWRLDKGFFSGSMLTCQKLSRFGGNFSPRLTAADTSRRRFWRLVGFRK